jgi:hypothetical protein
VSSLIIHQAAFSDEGEYKCAATNRSGHIITKAKLRLEGTVLVNGFIAHLHLGITSNCNAAQITITHTSLLNLSQPPLIVARLQPSIKGYSSRPYG